MKNINISIPNNTADWLFSSNGEEILSRHVKSAGEAFLEPNLSERLHAEYTNSLQGGTKLFRIGNSLRALSSQLATLSLGYAVGIDIPAKVWDAVHHPYMEILLSIGEVNFQGKMQQDPEWKSDLWTADIGSNLALVYRLNAPIGISQDDLRDFIINRCLYPILADWMDDSTRIHSLDSMGHNWWAVIVGGAGIMAALLELDMYKDRIYDNLAKWFNFQGNDFSRKHANFGERGDFIEGFGYADYALKNPCRLALIDPEFKLVPDCLSQAQAEGLAQWYIHTFTETRNGYKAVAFSDMHSSYLPSPEVMHTLARLTGNTELLMVTHQLRPEPANAFDFIAWEPKPENFLLSVNPVLQKPDLFHNSGLAFIEGNEMSLAVRAGEFWGHNHLDAGSFIFQDGGIIWIDDSGTCEYTKPEYSNYYVMPQAHNISFATDSLPDANRARFEGMQSTGKYLASDGNEYVQMLQVDTNILNGGALLRSIRNLLVLNGKTLLIWDDLSGYDDRSFEFLLHTACQIGEVSDRQIELSYEGIICPLSFFSTSDSSFTSKTDISGNICLRWQTSDVLRQKFGLVMGTKLISTSWKTTDSNWICNVETDHNKWSIWFNHRADGRIMHQNCISQWDDIETDAYALIMQEIEGKRILTIIQGSYARSGSEVFYSNLSRQTLTTVVIE